MGRRAREHIQSFPSIMHTQQHASSNQLKKCWEMLIKWFILLTRYLAFDCILMMSSSSSESVPATSSPSFSWLGVAPILLFYYLFIDCCDWFLWDWLNRNIPTKRLRTTKFMKNTIVVWVTVVLLWRLYWMAGWLVWAWWLMASCLGWLVCWFG